MANTLLRTITMFTGKLDTSPPKAWWIANRAVALPVVFGAAVLLAFGLGRHSRSPNSTTPQAESAQVSGVSQAIPLTEQQLRQAGLTLIRPELITTIERPITGFVEAQVGARAQVGMPVGGQVMRLLVAPGQRVQAGSVLAEVRSPEAAAIRAEADGSAATAQSLEQQYQRALPMARQGALAWHELETRRIASVKARTDARSAQAKVRAIGSPTSAGVFQIRSPITGTVAALDATPGSMLQAGSDLAEITDTSGRELRFMVSPLLAASLKSDQLLRVTAGNQELRARVVAVAPDSASTNRVMIVRAIPVSGALPPAGTAVTAFALVPSSERQFTVPRQAVQLLNGEPVVYRYLRGSAQPVRVVLGPARSDRVEIVQGLQGGEQILNGNTAVLLQGDAPAR